MTIKPGDWVKVRYGPGYGPFIEEVQAVRGNRIAFVSLNGCFLRQVIEVRTAEDITPAKEQLE